MLVVLRPMKLIQPKFNVVVAAVTNGLTCTLIRLHKVLLSAVQPVHASHIQTIGTSSTLVLFCNVLCALTSRRQFVSNKFIAQKKCKCLRLRHRLGFNFEILISFCAMCVWVREHILRKNRSCQNSCTMLACYFVPCQVRVVHNNLSFNFLTSAIAKVKK